MNVCYAIAIAVLRKAGIVGGTAVGDMTFIAEDLLRRWCRLAWRADTKRKTEKLP